MPQPVSPFDGSAQISIKRNVFSAFLLNLPGVIWICPECISIQALWTPDEQIQRTHSAHPLEIFPAVCLCHMANDIVVKCSRSKWKFTQDDLIKQVWKLFNAGSYSAPSSNSSSTKMRMICRTFISSQKGDVRRCLTSYMIVVLLARICLLGTFWCKMRCDLIIKLSKPISPDSIRISRVHISFQCLPFTLPL